MDQVTPDETILGLIAAEARHGYQLLNSFRDPDELGRVWNLSTSQLYAVLKRLEREGCITGRTVESPNAPARVEYRLTTLGEERLDAWLNDRHPPASNRRVRVEFLSRLYIARLLSLPTGEIIHAQKQACRARRSELVAQRDLAQPGVGLLALDLAIMQLDATLVWIDRCEIIPLDIDKDVLP